MPRDYLRERLLPPLLLEVLVVVVDLVVVVVVVLAGVTVRVGVERVTVVLREVVVFEGRDQRLFTVVEVVVLVAGA